MEQPGPAVGGPDDRLREGGGRFSYWLSHSLHYAEVFIGPAQRVRPLAGPMAGSGRTRWLHTGYRTGGLQDKPETEPGLSASKTRGSPSYPRHHPAVRRPL